MRMLLIGFGSFFFFSFVTVSQAAFLHEPAHVSEVPTLQDISGETIYGKLDDFPHTFAFSVSEETPLTIQVSMSTIEEMYDVSLILIRQETRGVSEVGRVSSKTALWKEKYDFARAVTFVQGESTSYLLQEGSYKLEVSSPENKRGYRLVLGKGSPQIFHEMSIARTVFGLRTFSIFFSPYVTLPFVLIGLFGYRRYKKKYV